MSNVRTAFRSEPDFCAECGSILPLPVTSSVVVCMSCNYTVDVAGFDGVEIKSRIVFNKRQVKNAGLTSDNFSGPTVQKECPKCGCKKMTYATRQTRSADEGQTVFYTCPKCRFQETEYS
ncbi:hypothetical protein NP493_813g01010 [Ridgeia piscesae]|uniref:DNA-directed RNA polymerase subunit n=1 Tax=Ridgeia piscesae TaxID=27915 RepID=A0AAD9KPJ8_RIDPI|nr:hypothetical protein NP493_813g01010 [Ridgeia piscesae]